MRSTPARRHRQNDLIYILGYIIELLNRVLGLQRGRIEIAIKKSPDAVFKFGIGACRNAWLGTKALI